MKRIHTVSFAAGLGVGAMLALVASRAHRRHSWSVSASDHFIDGTRQPTNAELAARPAEEANATVLPHLESEAADIEPDTQRW
jgi:hypothetical protein